MRFTFNIFVFILLYYEMIAKLFGTARGCNLKQVTVDVFLVNVTVLVVSGLIDKKKAVMKHYSFFERNF